MEKKVSMGLQFIERALFKIGFFKPIIWLCEHFLSAFWRMKFQNIMAGYSNPVWFPHRLDLATWHMHCNSHFLERGVYSNEVIAPGDTVLELCCGDGLYSHFFFSNKAKHIDAIDIDQVALSHAREYHSLPNIRYYLADIVEDPFPRNEYNVVIWDSAIRRIDKEEINIVLKKIKSVLKPTNGILSCYEIFESSENSIEFITPLCTGADRDVPKMF